MQIGGGRNRSGAEIAQLTGSKSLGNARATGGPGILPETCGITSTDPTINRPLLPNPGFYQQQTFAACCEVRCSDPAEYRWSSCGEAVGGGNKGNGTVLPDFGDGGDAAAPGAVFGHGI
jgi:hypothetical protein